MRRSLVIRAGGAELPLTFEVTSPEVETQPVPAQRVAPRVLSVRTPLGESDLRQLSGEPWDLVVWANARASFTDSEGFLDGALALRSAAGPAPMIWAPRVALPGRLALLHLLGIDLVDTTEGARALAEGRSVTVETGPLETGRIPSQQVTGPAEAELAALEHVYEEEEERVRRAISEGRLRILAESRVSFEPVLGEILRYLDRKGFAISEVHSPVTGDAVHPYATKESQHRPEAERFRRRFLERYRPPPGRRLLVIVPCSRTKPYSRSPSHRRFLRALEEGGGMPGIHLVSVTSPLGLVPRELESVYPAAHYDLPVTGDWDEEERAWVRRSLTHLMGSTAYRRVLVHLPRDEMGWLDGELPASEEVRWTVQGNSVGSRESLLRLTQEVRTFWQETSERSGGRMQSIREELASLAGFQFGPAAIAPLFPPGARLMGRPWFQRLVAEGGETLATWKEDSGLWRLTVPGARALVGALPGYLTEVRGGVELKGDLFAPGVHRGGGEIRPGDDTVLVRGGEVLGVGEAKVPGSWMGRLTHGMVVKVRHRSHGTGPASPSVAEQPP